MPRSIPGRTSYPPASAALHLDATGLVSAGASGTWRDSVGRSGAWLFTPGAGTGGPMRPIVGPVSYGSVLTQPTGGADRGLSATVAIDTGVPNDAAGVYGRFGGAIAALTSAAPAGVRGDSGANVGVYGLSATGFGVAGGANTGVGVQGYAVAGAASIGVQAVHSTGGTALEIRNGSLAVSGDVRTAFTHVVTPASLEQPSQSCFQHPLSDNDSRALVFATAQYFAKFDSVQFLSTGSSGQGKWCILAPGAFTLGQSFVVLVIKQAP